MAHAGGCGTSCSCPCTYEARSIAPMQKRASGPRVLVAVPCSVDACIGSQDIFRQLTAQLRAVRDKTTCTGGAHREEPAPSSTSKSCILSARALCAPTTIF